MQQKIKNDLQILSAKVNALLKNKHKIIMIIFLL